KSPGRLVGNESARPFALRSKSPTAWKQLDGTPSKPKPHVIVLSRPIAQPVLPISENRSTLSLRSSNDKFSVLLRQSSWSSSNALLRSSADRLGRLILGTRRETHEPSRNACMRTWRSNRQSLVLYWRRWVSSSIVLL